MDHMDQADPGMHAASLVGRRDSLLSFSEFLLSRGSLSQLAAEAARLKQLAVLHRVSDSLPHMMQRLHSHHLSIDTCGYPDTPPLINGQTRAGHSRTANECLTCMFLLCYMNVLILDTLLAPP